jgi:hypothetical protein
MEERRLETSRAMNDLDAKITKQGEKITESFTEFKKDVLNGIAQSDNKIKSLELWRQLIIGGAIVAGFLVSSIISTKISSIINPPPIPITVTTPIK